MHCSVLPGASMPNHVHLMCALFAVCAQDHWEAPYKYDNRRYYGNMYMHHIGQEEGATMDGLLEVLTKDPIQNRYTSITVVMCPKSQEIQSFDVYTEPGPGVCDSVDGQCTVGGRS